MKEHEIWAENGRRAMYLSMAQRQGGTYGHRHRWLGRSKHMDRFLWCCCFLREPGSYQEQVGEKGEVKGPNSSWCNRHWTKLTLKEPKEEIQASTVAPSWGNPPPHCQIQKGLQETLSIVLLGVLCLASILPTLFICYLNQNTQPSMKLRITVLTVMFFLQRRKHSKCFKNSFTFLQLVYQLIYDSFSKIIYIVIIL